MDYTQAQMRRMSCDNCGQEPFFTDPFRRIEVDHVIPLSKGGKDDDTNWQPLCGRCNRHKSDMTNREARTARALPDYAGVMRPWPRGFDWETRTWQDGSGVDWVYGQLFSYPVRVALPVLEYTEAK